MEKRTGKIIVGKAGGTAGENSKTYKISLPTKWVKEMDIDGREVELYFDGGSIKISNPVTLQEFAQKGQRENHLMYRLEYYSKDELCTVIYADFTDEALKIKNCTKALIKTAFGANESPDWDDFRQFLEERCVPKNRSGIREYLEAIGLEKYEPFEIIQHSGGKMAEDKQWLKVEKI